MGKKFACHKISEGKAQAEAIISKDRIMFYQVRPEDGMMEEKNHYLEGRIIAKKVLLFPGGKGSSVVQQDGLYHLDRFHNMPACRTPIPCWSPVRSLWRSPWSTACRKSFTRPSRTATRCSSMPTRVILSCTRTDNCILSFNLLLQFWHM